MNPCEQLQSSEPPAWVPLAMAYIVISVFVYAPFRFLECDDPGPEAFIRGFWWPVAFVKALVKALTKMLRE